MDGEGKGRPDKDLTADVISAAIAVHRALGPGFLESIYEEALGVELATRNLPLDGASISRPCR